MRTTLPTQQGQLTFGFPHWSHLAYLAGEREEGKAG